MDGDAPFEVVVVAVAERGGEVAQEEAEAQPHAPDAALAEAPGHLHFLFFLHRVSHYCIRLDLPWKTNSYRGIQNTLFC